MRQPVLAWRAVAAAGTKKTAVPADRFESVLTEAQRAEQAAKAPPLPNFSKMTDKQKISALATLHNATDYSGMTDVEKYKLMNDRFEAAFPVLGAYTGGVIGGDSVSYYGEGRLARPEKGTASRIQKEQARQWESQGLRDLPKLHREAYYPGMTDGEAARAIVLRHEGGTLADQAHVLRELQFCGLGDSGKISEALTEMRARLVQWAKKSKGYAGTETANATEEAAVQALATGNRIRSGNSTDWGTIKRFLAENADAWDQRVADGYGQYVQGGIDGIVDEIVRGEDAGKGAAPEDEGPAAAPRGGEGSL